MSHWFFDTRWCATHGIGRFATELRQRLGGLRPLEMRGSPTGLADSFRLASHLRRVSALGYFSPGFNVPAWTRCPVITTIHDLIHVHFPAECSAAKQAYYSLLQKRVIRDSPVTLTVSEFSRQQIIDFYGLSSERVVCVGNGVSKAFCPEGPVYQSDRPYFLYVGNARPHKNVPMLMRAFAELRRRVDTRLIVVGNQDPGLQRLAFDLAIADHVGFRTKVSDGELAAFYRGAVGLVMPSYFEGFGLPLVEAMASGCSVIAANRTSIPEVVGEAGILVDPDRPEELAEAMHSLIQDDTLARQLRRSGQQRATQFCWNKVASRVEVALRPYLGELAA